MKKIGDYAKEFFETTDKLLLFSCVATALYGMLILTGMCFSLFDSPRMLVVQAVAFGLGLIIALFLSTIDYHTMAELWPFHATLCWALVLGTFIFGYTRPGTDDKAWYLLPGGIMFQPAEIAKISFIILFAYHLSKTTCEEINKPSKLFSILLHGIIPIAIVHFQGDDGTALIFAAIFMSMIFAAGLKIRYLAVGFSAIAVSAPLVFFFLMSPGKQQRLMNVFFPENDLSGSGWQQYQGRISIGAGGVFGKGLFNPELRKFSEVKNDFVFAFIGEALGLIGCLLVLFAISFICYRILIVGNYAQDRLGALICVGFFTLFCFQSILNLGMCLSVLPVIGVTLPFFSSGGSSLLTSFIGIGIILSVSRYNKKNLFYS